MKCIECGNSASHVLCTQFAGDHPYCYKHAVVSGDMDEMTLVQEYITSKEAYELKQATERREHAEKIHKILIEKEAVERFTNWFLSKHPDSGVNPFWIYNTWQEYLNVSK